MEHIDLVSTSHSKPEDVHSSPGMLGGAMVDTVKPPFVEQLFEHPGYFEGE